MQWFAFATGGWALAMLALFIAAIRLSYRIEARSSPLHNKSGFPRNAMMFHTVFNIGVASDADTQRMRRKMLVLLLSSLVGLAAMGVAASSLVSSSPAG